MRPTLSIVAAARNDDHGGNLLHRMQIFVNGIAAQCSRHDLTAELVLVEWNPPRNKASLLEALTWDSGQHLSVRIITVPEEVHNRYRYSDRLPMFQMIAKNVGIRRSHSDFVLATNVDLLFSDELMRYLATYQLRNDRSYRVNRYDVDSSIPINTPLDDQLHYCAEHVIRINTKSETQVVGEADVFNVVSSHPPKTPTIARLIPKRIKNTQQYSGLRRRRINKHQLNTNAAGDFTLLSKDTWFELKGYAELEAFSMHLDSLLCYAAHHAGATQITLPDPMRIYHIEHGSGWRPEVEQGVFDNPRLDPNYVPQVTTAQLFDWTSQMRRERRPIIFNGPDWGLPDEDFPETLLPGADASD